MGAEDEPGSADNVQYFRDLLAKHPSLLLAKRDVYGSALGWLRRQSPDALSRGFLIHKECAAPAGYGQLLRELGFKPRNPRKRAPSGRAANQRPLRWHSGIAAAAHDWLRWEQPPALGLLRLDTAALDEALHLGPSQRRRRVFLSAATLVVVPPELIQHWRDQIEWHTRAGALRVAVYDCKSEP